MLRTAVHLLDDHRHWLFGLVYVVFLWVGWQEAQELSALPATQWMNIFNFGLFETWPAIGDYFLRLRTGVPPVISFLEILAFKLTGSYQPVTQTLYRVAFLLMLMLPLAFTRRRVSDYLVHLALAFLMLKALIPIAMGNPQVYDVLLPVFLMLFLWLMRRAERHDHRRGWQMWLMFWAGFFLSMAELARPFMLVLVPVLIGITIFRFRKRSYTFIPFLLPLLLFSGGWHAKLLIHHGQLIWSNHSGGNLATAWAPLLDHRSLRKSLEPEEPPIIDNGYTWDNINTEVHARNTAKMKAEVFRAIQAQPGAALDHLLDKIVEFTAPQVGMYGREPEGRAIDWYRIVVRCSFWVLAFLLIRAIWMLAKDWRYMFRTEAILIGTSAFLTFIPVIGEYGEEARFLVSVIPFLMWGMIHVAFLLLKTVSSGAYKPDS